LVALPPPAGAAAAPPFNGRLLYASTAGCGSPNTTNAASELWVSRPDGSEHARLLAQAAYQAVWSPNGARVAFGKVEADGTGDIYVMGADGSGAVNLTSTPGVTEVDPEWSPNGDRLLFVRYVPQEFTAWWGDVFSMNPDGSNVDQVTTGGTWRTPAWSPDGGSIAVVRQDGPAGAGGIYLMNPDGTSLRILFLGDLVLPSWHPSGDTIAAIDGNWELWAGAVYFVDVLSGEARQSNSNGDICGRPVWSPEGDFLALTRGSTWGIAWRNGSNWNTVSRGVVTSWQPTNVNRIYGADRFETANEVSVDSFQLGTARAVVLARGDVFADAVTGTPLAAAKGAPILLTRTEALDGPVTAELTAVLPRGSTVYLLGGPAALSANVEQQVRNLGYQPVRFGGANRWQTAGIVADRGLGNPNTVLLANGLDFPDPLIAGASAAQLGGAVLLTQGSVTGPDTDAYLSAHAPSSRYAIGGAATAAAPGATSIAGADQFETSVMAARRFFSSPSVVGIASGVTFPDGLTGGAHVARLGGPLLLTQPTVLPPGVASYLDETGSITAAHLYGGRAAVSWSVFDSIDQALR